MNKLKTGNILFALTLAGIALFWFWHQQNTTTILPNNTLPTEITPKQAPTDSDATQANAMPDDTPKGELPPPEVAATFKKMYRQVPQGSLFWTKQTYGWDVAFEIDHNIMEVEFNNAGTWLEIEEESVNEIRIPQKIKDRLASQYPDATIKELEIETTSKGLFYEIELIHNGKEKEVYFDDQASPARNEYED